MLLNKRKKKNEGPLCQDLERKLKTCRKKSPSVLFPITRRVSAFNVKTNLTFFRFNDSFVFCFFAPHHEEEAAFTKKGKSVAFRQTAGTVSRRRSTFDLPVRARSGSSNWIHSLAWRWISIPDLATFMPILAVRFVHLYFTLVTMSR